MSKSLICETINCGNELSGRSQLTTCQTCRSSLYYWKKKRPAEVLDRRRRLHKYDDRLTVLIGDKK